MLGNRRKIGFAGVIAVAATIAMAGCAGWTEPVVGPPAAIPMPNFVGLDVATATVLINNLGLQPAADFETGIVGSQDPLPNVEVAPGSTVHLAPEGDPTPTGEPTPTGDPTPTATPTP